MIKDTASREIPLPREVLIDAARLKAHGAEWEAIAQSTGAAVGDLVTFSIDHPEVWGPLYERAEKLRLQEAEGETIKGLCTLLKGDDEEASESAAKELLVHRRHVERRRQGGSRAKPPDLGIRISECGMDQSAIPNPQSAMAAEATAKYPEFLTEDPPPEQIVRRITYAANRVAHGDDYHRIARETGQTEIDVTRWSFIYAKAWDRAYPTARRAAAQAGAALAINRLLIFVTSPDLKQAARAARTLLVHRRHMHWAQTNQPPRHQDTKNLEGLNAAGEEDSRLPERGLVPPTGGDSLAKATPGGRTLTICQGGQKTSLGNETQNGERPATRALRPSADSASVVKKRLPRSRDGPG